MTRMTAAFVAIAVLGGCAGSQPLFGAPAAPSLAGGPSYAERRGAPPACAGQRTTKRFGSLRVRLKATGGAFCIPAFGGFGGSMAYPGVERAAALTIRTSTQNIYDEPQLGSGTSIVYVNLHFHAGVHFGSNLRHNGGLTSQTITPGEPYTAYGIVAVGHLDLMFPPCVAVATQGPYGGVLPNIGTLFRNATVTGAGYGVIEIYAGAQVSQAC